MHAPAHIVGKRPHTPRAGEAQIAHGALRVHRGVGRLHVGAYAELDQASNVGGTDAFQMLQPVGADPRSAVARERLGKDVEGAAHRTVADRVNADGIALLGSMQHQLAHTRGVDSRPPGISGVIRIRVGLPQPCRMRRGHAVEKLLEASQAHARAFRKAPLEIARPRQVVERRGEQAHAQVELACTLKPLERVIAEHIGPCLREKRHIAHAGDAARMRIGDKRTQCLGLLLRTQPIDAGKQRERRGFLHDAGQAACRILAIDPARRRNGIVVDPQQLERRPVQPQRMDVGAHETHRPRGIRAIELGSIGQLGLAPQRMVPAVPEQELVLRARIFNLRKRIDAILRAGAHAERREARAVHGGKKEMEMRIDQAGAHETVSDVDERRSGQIGLQPAAGTRIRDAVALHDHAAIDRLPLKSREQGPGRDNRPFHL